MKKNLEMPIVEFVASVVEENTISVGMSVIEEYDCDN